MQEYKKFVCKSYRAFSYKYVGVNVCQKCCTTERICSMIYCLQYNVCQTGKIMNKKYSFFYPTHHISCAALHFILRCNICFYRFICSIHPPTFQAFLLLFEENLPSSYTHKPEFSNCLGRHSLTTESSNNSSRKPNTSTPNTTTSFPL
jgi:hypothetical protein